MTEIFINNVPIDLKDGVPIPLNYSIADIREPDKRNSAFSKTITVPGTKANNKVFGHLFKVDLDIHSTGTTNYTPSFNPNLKAETIIYENKVKIFKGFAQLVKINVTDYFQIEYDIVVFGDLANIFSELGDDKVDELDYSAYNHTYSGANIIASWGASAGYYYPMIDYGKNNLQTWKVTDFYPAIYLYQLIDKIFENAGYTYVCSLFGTQSFKNIVIPFNSDGLRLPESLVLNRYAKANKTATTDYIFSSNATTINFNNEISDAGSNYNPVTYQYTAPANGTYNIAANITCALKYEPSSPAYIWTPTSISCTVEFFKIQLNSNQVQVFSVNVINGTPLMPVQDTVVNFGDVSASYQFDVNQSVYLLSGEKLVAKIKPFGYSTTYGGLYFDVPLSGLGTQNVIAGDLYYRITNASELEVKFINNELQEGETVVMNGALPKDIKQRDILTSVFKAFNLYVQDSDTTSRQLIINTRNDFYTNEYVDWTEKLDISKQFEIQPMAALEARRYVYKYDDDSDYYNDIYKKVYLKSYGERWVDIENDFLKGNKETKLIFASTPSVGQSWNDRVIPAIVKVDQNGNKSIKSSKIRMLFRTTTGVLNCDLWFMVINGVSTPISQYPYVGHLNDPYNSTEDLNFSVPNEIFFTGNIFYTNNNLYNKYYKKFVEEITDKNSKIITADFYLTASDISNLDFRKKVLIDNTYYLINKVIDYQPNANTTTKVELLKIKSGISFIASTGTVTSSLGDPFGIGDDTLPSARYTTNDSNNNGNISVGSNYVHPLAETTIVTGYDNVVGANAKMVTILGSSGCVVDAGLQNVSLINTSGVTVSENNVHYVNGVNVSSYAQGSYTPSTTNVTNVDSVTIDSAYYFRIGSMVTVFGVGTLNATLSATDTIFRFSIPIASDFSTELEAAGGINGDVSQSRIEADSTNNAVRFYCKTNTTGGFVFSYSFSYIII